MRGRRIFSPPLRLPSGRLVSDADVAARGILQRRRCGRALQSDDEDLEALRQKVRPMDAGRES